MVQVGSLFTQVLSLVNRNDFFRAVQQWDAERAAKGFRCWDQFVAMVFCQMASADSLREICGGLSTAMGKLTHLGLKAAPSRSTLSYANTHRPWQLYETVFYQLLDQTFRQRIYRDNLQLQIILDSNDFKMNGFNTKWRQL